jgi:predicted HicB family RNase H-like nuclease
MKDIHVRLPDEIHAKLVAIAGAERRSLNSQLIVLIERAPDPGAGHQPGQGGRP